MDIIGSTLPPSERSQRTDTLGLGLLPKFLIEQELAGGRLLVAQGGPTQSIGAYYLVWPRERSDYQPLVSFRHWLETHAGPSET